MADKTVTGLTYEVKGKFVIYSNGQKLPLEVHSKEFQEKHKPKPASKPASKKATVKKAEKPQD